MLWTTPKLQNKPDIGKVAPSLSHAFDCFLYLSPKGWVWNISKSSSVKDLLSTC